ncbi:MAG TPA: DNA primase [Parachlamydiaceae bacterium]|nr:DNA primase [Parachlamydiaceae bacterium]
MPIFSKESLETLRQRVDLVEVLSAHMDLKRSGASYKGLCPFHDEKTPSFTIQKGDTHYHCFGCGAHGDSIQFLMGHLKMSFLDAVESLAQRFNVPLQQVESSEENKGPNKGALKEALDIASNFYQLMLLHTPEGHDALRYLFKRGIDIDFVRRYRIGLAPREHGMLRKVLSAKLIKDEVSAEAGLISPGKENGWRDFFQDRITFPICDPTGAVIGFSARKYKEDTFGGKYINTAETPLFKKSKVLFALHHSRRRIAKERKAIIVEGQIDALRLIDSGFNIAVAGQGTAFGESHARELIALGLNEVYLAMDSDEAGRQAAYKIGDFFQKEGIETRVVNLPHGEDPDSFLRENGPEAFLGLMQNSSDYLTFIVKLLSQKINIESPAGKNELVQILTKQIRSWDRPLMVHESLRKLAHLVRVPEAMLGVGQDYMPNIYIKKSGSIGLQTINPDRILESDFLRWLLLAGHTFANFNNIAKLNIKPADLHIEVCRRLYEAYFDCFVESSSCDLLALAIHLDDEEGQTLMSEILQKKVNLERAEEHFKETVQKILDRNWMEIREDVKSKIQSAQCSDEEVLVLVKSFDELRRNQPKIQFPA